MIDCEPPFETITIPGITIISPNYPKYYGYHLDCQVTLTFEDRVSIVFKDFDTGGSHKDWLKVHDGDSSNSNLIGHLCSDDIPNPMTSTGNSMTLVFHSNHNFANIGFKIMALQGSIK